MAVTSGSCYSSYARNTRFRIDWERTGTWNDNSGCGSIIRWKLMLENGNKWYSNAIRCNAIYINGVKVHDGNTWSNYTSTGTYELIGWQSNVRIAHNNAGNEKTFNINYTGWFYSSYNVSASTDFTLPSIPRGTSITSFTASKRNETSLTLTWKTADAIAEVYYSTNNGTNWTKDSATNVSSGTITASGLSPNTTYQCKIKVVRNTIETFSSQVSATTNQIPSQWLSSRTETSITMGWWLDANASQIRYSSNNGSSWSSWINVSGTQGTYTISGLSAGTSYNIKTEVKRSATGTSYPTATTAVWTLDYPYLVSANSFVIGDYIHLKLYNPLQRSLTIYIKGNDNSTICTSTRTINGETDISSNTAEINAQYASIPNSQTGSYKVRIVCSALSRDTTVNGNTYSVNTSACIPTFSDFAYKDTTNNALTQAIDNNQILVQNVSSVNVVISSANKMVAKNSATASKYAATFSNLSNQNIPYSSSDIDTNLGVVTGKGNQTFKVIAYDSRNISKEVSKAVNVIEYSAPIVNVSLNRLNNFEAETHLKLSGTFARVTIDNADKNAIQQIQYRYKESSASTWGAWTTMTIQSQGIGSYQTTEVTLSLDNTKQFTFEFQVTDRAKTTSTSQVLSIGQPLMFLHTSGKLEVNGPITIPRDNAIQFNGLNTLRGNSYNNTILSANGAPVYLRPNGDLSTGGEVVIRTTGEIVSNAVNEAFIHKHPNSGVQVAFGIGSGGTNRGMWDETLNKWHMYYNGSRLVLNDDVQITGTPTLLGLPYVLKCKTYSSQANSYVDMDLKYDSTAEYDRRVYYYMGVTNGSYLVAGVFTYDNGRIAEHKQLTTAHTASVSANSNHTIRISLPSNWATVILISTFPM